MGSIQSNIDYPLYTITQDPSGFEDPSVITMTYDETTRKITITSSTGFVKIIENRKRYSFASPYVTDAHADFVGINTYYLTFSNGSFTWSTTAWTFNLIQVASVIWNSTQTPKGFFVKEPHGLMPWQAHEHFHQIDGAILISGGTLANYTPLNTTDAGLTFSIPQTIIEDEDLTHTLSALADGGPYTILSRSGASGDWIWSTTNTVPLLRDGSAQVYVNQLVTGSWALTAVGRSNNDRINYYVCALPNGNSGLFRYIIIPGQVVYSSLTAAQAESFQSLSLGTLSTILPELYPFAQVTYRRNSSTTSYIEAVTYLRGTSKSIVGSGAVASNHNSLSGRDAASQHPLAAIYPVSTNKVIVSNAAGTAIEETTTTTAEINTLNTSAGNAYKLVGFNASGAPRVDGTDAHILAQGTTAERPTPSAGMIRYNTDLGIYESYQTAASGWIMVGRRWGAGALSDAGSGTTVFTPPSGGGGLPTCVGYNIFLRINNGTNSQLLKVCAANDNGTWRGSVESVGGVDLNPTISVTDATGALVVDGINGTYKFGVEGFIF